MNNFQNSLESQESQFNQHESALQENEGAGMFLHQYIFNKKEEGHVQPQGEEHHFDPGLSGINDDPETPKQQVGVQQLGAQLGNGYTVRYRDIKKVLELQHQGFKATFDIDTNSQMIKYPSKMGGSSIRGSSMARAEDSLKQATRQRKAAASKTAKIFNQKLNQNRSHQSSTNNRATFKKSIYNNEYNNEVSFNQQNQNQYDTNQILPALGKSQQQMMNDLTDRRANSGMDTFQSSNQFKYPRMMTKSSMKSAANIMHQPGSGKPSRLDLNDYSIISEPEKAALKGSCFAGYKVPTFEANTGSLPALKQLERLRASRVNNGQPQKTIEMKLYEYSKSAQVNNPDRRKNISTADRNFRAYIDNQVDSMQRLSSNHMRKNMIKQSQMSQLSQMQQSTVLTAYPTQISHGLYTEDF